MSPHREEFPRLSTEKTGNNLKKLFRVEHENVAQVLFIHNKLDYLVGVLLPLSVGEVTIWKLLAFEERRNHIGLLLLQVSLLKSLFLRLDL